MKEKIDIARDSDARADRSFLLLKFLAEIEKAAAKASTRHNP